MVRKLVTTKRVISIDMKHEITADVLQAARQNPDGWVYKIDSAFGPNDNVPPEAIVGAWKVDSSGNIVGAFIPNPNYRHPISK